MQKIRPDLDIGHNIQRLRKAAGMTQDQADQRYLKLSGGTMQGDVNFSAGEDPSMSRGVKFTVNMESAHLHGLNEGSGTMLEASDQMGELVRLRFADPVASTDGATKGYVDEEANNARPYANRYTLSSGGWSNQRYTMTVYGINSDNTKQVVSISPDTETDWEAWVDAGVYCIGPNGVSNQLVFKCNTAPTANIALVIAIQEMKVYAS